jgi:hypothetical protein
MIEFFLQQEEHVHSLDFKANAFLSSFDQSKPPTAPSALVGKNDTIASTAVLIPHAGCQYSGWCPVIVKHIFLLVSNRPFGVRNITEGGLKGYSAGNNILP